MGREHGGMSFIYTGTDDNALSKSRDLFVIGRETLRGKGEGKHFPLGFHLTVCLHIGGD